MVESTPFVDRRKLIASGTSIVLTIPKTWLEEQGLEAGDEVLMVANGNILIQKITQESVQQVRRQLQNLPKETS